MKSGLRLRRATRPAMVDYRLSQKAAADLDAVAEFTIQKFGIDQARRYRDSLKNCFERLADNPELGRRAEQLARGLKRFEHQSHIVFYTSDADGLLIVRVLHSRMDVFRHF
jgi:toxin ParE1/3/4